MIKSKKITISLDLEVLLGIDEQEINTKMQQFVEGRKKALDSEIFLETEVAKEFMRLFSKAELCGLLMHASTNAGFLEFKLIQMAEQLNISKGLFEKIMSLPIPEEKEIIKLLRSEGPKDNGGFL